MKRNIWLYIIFAMVIISIIWCLLKRNKTEEEENINIQNKIEKKFNYDYDINKYYIYKADGTIKDIINPEEFEEYEYDPNLDYLNETTINYEN